MTNLTTPSGFTPRTLTSWSRYFIPQADANAYRVGDAVKSAGGTDAAGIVAVTLHTGTGPARGVIVAVDPGLPATGGLTNGQKLAVPAAKLQDYYVWVDDDPTHTFAIVDDGLTPANSVAANAGSYANFTPSTGPAANGGSVAALTSSTLGGTSGCLKVVSLQPGSAYGAFATWLVKFAVHELANSAPGGGSGGSSTLAALTDMGTYDIGSNNPSVTAIKNTANNAATAASGAQTTANAAIPATQKGAVNGVAQLDGAQHLPATQLPALTGDVTSTAGGAATVLAATAPALSQQSTNAQTGTTYTLVLADAGNNVDMNNAAANTLTIPPHSAVAFPVGTLITVTMAGAGVTTIAAGAGVTIVKPPARTLAISAQYETAQLYQAAQDTWRVLAG